MSEPVIPEPVTPIDPLSPVHAYLQVADLLEARIVVGEFGPAGGRLPAERAPAGQYGIAYATIRQAAAVLRQRGAVATRQGRGTFVAGGRPR